MRLEALNSPSIHRRWTFSLFFAAILVGLTFLLLQRFSFAPVRPGTIKLQTLPLQIGAWQGTEERLEPEIVTVLKLDDWLQRQYRRGADAFVWFYIGYYAEHPNYHSPTGCYPANGWTITDQDVEQIPIPGAETILVHKLIVQKGLQKRLVLYWYQWGQVSLIKKNLKDFSYTVKEYRVKLAALLQGKAPRRDKALVRVSAPIVGSLEATLAREVAFIQAAYPLLLERFAPDASS